MNKRVPLVVLLLAPLLLSGCSETASGTPFFKSGEGVSDTIQAQPTNNTAQPTSSTVKPSNNPSGTTQPSKETKAPETNTAKSLEEKNKEFAKKYDLKIDKNGVPYSDRGNVPITEGPEYEAVKKANETRTDASTRNDFNAPSSTVDELVGIYNSYYKSLVNKDWDKACTYVNLEETSVADCIKSLQDNGPYRKDLKGMTRDTVQIMVFDNENIVLTLGLERAINESATFIKTPKGWKISANLT